MKPIICFFAVVACAVAAPPDLDAVVKNERFEISPDGQFLYGFETSNGIKSEASGQPSGEQGAIVISGKTEYTSDDGKVISTSYTADAQGYHPKGDHLPTPPPSPPAVLRQLEFLEKNPQYVEPTY